jgi:hypothetical protein
MMIVKSLLSVFRSCFARHDTRSTTEKLDAVHAYRHSSLDPARLRAQSEAVISDSDEPAF